MSQRVNPLYIVGGLILALGGVGFFAIKSAMDKKEFLKKLSVAALPVSKETGIPISFIVAQAAHESGYGMSRLSLEANNLFGIKADEAWIGAIIKLQTREVIAGKEILTQATFRKYGSYEASVRDWAKFLQKPRYQYALKAALNDDSKGFFDGLQKAGYATDPSYSVKLQGVLKQIAALV